MLPPINKNGVGDEVKEKEKERVSVFACSLPFSECRNRGKGATWYEKFTHEHAHSRTHVRKGKESSTSEKRGKTGGKKVGGNGEKERAINNTEGKEQSKTKSNVSCLKSSQAKGKKNTPYLRSFLGVRWRVSVHFLPPLPLSRLISHPSLPLLFFSHLDQKCVGGQRKGGKEATPKRQQQSPPPCLLDDIRRPSPSSSFLFSARLSR